MRKTVFAGGFLCVACAFIPAIALGAGIDGTGSIPTCPTSGTLKIKPGLLTGGVLPGEIKLVAKSSAACAGGTGDGANIIGVKIKAAGTSPTNECSSFDGTTSTDLAVTFKYKVAKDTPKLNPSTGTFSLDPGDAAPNGHATWALSGVISAGSFTGAEITPNIESDETAVDLVTGVCSEDGLKKVLFGKDDQTASCVNGPDRAAAITKQITSIDGNDVPHLELELLTVTASPFKLSATDISNPAGMQLESLSTNCTQDPNGDYRCRHSAFFVSTGACQWDGNYGMDLSYACDPANTCSLCSGSETIGMTLDTENFCDGNTEFCVVDLSCSEATAGASTGGVPCCSDTYSPLIQCLESQCATECATVIAAEGGIVPSSPCHTCAFANCNAMYNACSADNQACVE
jgi:hypothetical protein